MKIQDNLHLEKGKNKKKIEKNKMGLMKDSIQYNSQDLDQNQKMDVNPFQLNTQNLNIVVSNNANNYCGRITGITYLEENNKITSGVDIQLFFGHKSKQPVYKTKSDNNGNFIIEDIPPGYYTLFAKVGRSLKYQSYFIKIFANHTVHHIILLK